MNRVTSLAFPSQFASVNKLWRVAAVAAAGMSVSVGALRAVAAPPDDKGPDGGLIAVIDGKEVPAPAIKMGDPAMIAKIIEEGKNHNQVMQHLEYLTKQIGPRLTGSSRAERANKWCMEMYNKWGLSNAHIEEWGTIPVRFDRGPSTGRIMVPKDGGFSPDRDLEFTTYSWSIGTQGPSRGPVVKMLQSEEEYKAVKDHLKGAWILLPEASGTGQQRRGVMGARYSSNIETRKKVKEDKVDPATLPYDERVLFDGILGFISPTRDLVITSSVPGWRTLDINNIPPDVGVILRKPDYDDIVKRLDAGDSFAVEFNLPHTFTAGPIPCYNTIAEIPGTTWPDQVVIVSGHLDSWDGPGSEGCTDNGTGTVTTLETARILMAAGAKPKRTIRFIDWTGEEQGLLGSRGYVDKHQDEIKAKVSACLVDDGGTNYDGGLPAAENMVPMLAAATAPVNKVFFDESKKEYMNVNIRNTGDHIATHGASDHASFNRVGVPGFFWDETGRADYNHTHHTQYDKLDQAIPEYLVQSSTCAAVTAYNLACADELLPRAAPPSEGDRPGGDRQANGGRRGDGAGAAPAPAAPVAAAPVKKKFKPILP